MGPIPKPDIVAKTQEEVRHALSEVYGEPVTLEGTAAVLPRCCLYVKQGILGGYMYTFRGGDGALYAIPIPMAIVNALCEEPEAAKGATLAAAEQLFPRKR